MAVSSTKRWGATKQRMLAVLADGQRHLRQELQACLYDELGPIKNIQCHLSVLRRELRPLGQDILCEVYNGNLYYRQVRLLNAVVSS
jgi:hypothetical protein